MLSVEDVFNYADVLLIESPDEVQHCEVYGCAQENQDEEVHVVEVSNEQGHYSTCKDCFDQVG